MALQRARSAPDPWRAAPNETALCATTYGVTTAYNATVRGGTRAIDYHNGSATFWRDGVEAAILGLITVIEVEFHVEPRDLVAFTSMLRHVVASGSSRGFRHSPAAERTEKRTINTQVAVARAQPT